MCIISVKKNFFLQNTLFRVMIGNNYKNTIQNGSNVLIKRILNEIE